MRVGRRSRRTRRVLVAVAVAALAATRWDQLATLVGDAVPAEAVAAADASPSPGGDARAIGDRLRVAGSDAAQAQVGINAPIGDPDAPAAPGEVVIEPPPEAFEAPVDPPAPPPAALASANPFEGVEPAGGTWAVMIGINDYPGTRHDLQSAVADAQDVNEALGRMGVPGDHRLLVRDSQASAGTIRLAVEWLNAHASEDAVAVFFYAGHVRKLDSGVEAIVAADGDVVSDSDLAGLLGGLRAKRSWIALAACYAGGFTEVLAPGRVLTAAAPANSLAYESADYGRSYLVEYMVRRAMIEGRAPSSVEAAFSWASQEIGRDHPNRRPVQFDNDPGELDLRPEGAVMVSRASSSSPQQTEPHATSSSNDPPPSSQSPPPPPPSSTTTTEPKKDDTCSNWTFGVAHCTGED